MDWTSVVVLALLVALDGLRRIPAQTIVLRRTLWSNWACMPRDAFDEAGLRLIALWPPLVLPLVLSAASEDSSSDAPGSPGEASACVGRFRRAVSRTRMHRAALRCLGGMTLFAIVIGVPWALSRFGAWGFVAALTGVLILALASSVAAFTTLHRLGAPWTEALRLSCPLLSPFAAPRASELTLQYAARGVPAVLIARALLGEARFARWVRPSAYDALQTSADVAVSSLAAHLPLHLGTAYLGQIVATPPLDAVPGIRYCPRCAVLYQDAVTTCESCSVEVLTAVPQSSATAPV